MLSYGSAVTSKSGPARAISDDDRHSRQLFKFLTPAKIALLVIVHIYCTASTQTRYNAALFTFLLREIEVPNTPFLSDRQLAPYQILCSGIHEDLSPSNRVHDLEGFHLRLPRRFSIIWLLTISDPS